MWKDIWNLFKSNKRKSIKCFYKQKSGESEEEEEHKSYSG
jgi:hypothetical protein